jgi:hypothetical protein
MIQPRKNRIAPVKKMRKSGSRLAIHLEWKRKGRVKPPPSVS